MVFVLEAKNNMLRDTCQWLRHLILTTQSIILPVRVKLGVIYIKIIKNCKCLQCMLAPPSGEILYNKDFVQLFEL